jgi:transposase
MMLAVLIDPYATGTFSSRQIARKIEEDIAYRVLAAGNFPAHRTTCDFRLIHLDELDRVRPLDEQLDLVSEPSMGRR